MDITSCGVCVDGVEGAELGEGPAVFAVPVLLAGPEEEFGCFLFLTNWPFEALIINKKIIKINYMMEHIRHSGNNAQFYTLRSESRINIF